MTTPLSEPLRLPCGLVLPNRIVKAAMTESLADKSNKVTPELVNLYDVWAAGGAGAHITGNIMVDRRYPEAAGNVVIDGAQDEAAMQGLRDMAQAVKQHGAVILAQISHAGRQTPGDLCERPVAPSAVPLDLPGRSIVKFGDPRALTTEEVDEVVSRFVHAICVCEQAGFDGVQVHAAHGYLISQFLSPKTNKRSDKWGGSLENRSRLLLEIIREARQRVKPRFAIGVKLNSADFQHGGFTHEDCLSVVEWLNIENVDFIEVSGGNYEQPQMMNAELGTAPDNDGRLAASTIAREAYFVEYAKSVSAHAKVPVMSTGGFRTKQAMEAALNARMTDLIGIARPLCTEPDLPARLIAGEADGAANHGSKKKLGPTRLLSPKSPFRLVKALNVWGMQAWYQGQIGLLASTGAPNINLGMLKALSQMQASVKRKTEAYREDMGL